MIPIARNCSFILENQDVSPKVGCSHTNRQSGGNSTPKNSNEQLRLKSTGAAQVALHVYGNSGGAHDYRFKEILPLKDDINSRNKVCNLENRVFRLVLQCSLVPFIKKMEYGM